MPRHAHALLWRAGRNRSFWFWTWMRITNTCESVASNTLRLVVNPWTWDRGSALVPEAPGISSGRDIAVSKYQPRSDVLPTSRDLCGTGVWHSTGWSVPAARYFSWKCGIRRGSHTGEWDVSLQACRTSRTGTYHVSSRPFSEEHAGGQSASGAHSFARSAFFLVSSFFLLSDWWQISWGGDRRYTECAYGECIGLSSVYASSILLFLLHKTEQQSSLQLSQLRHYVLLLYAISSQCVLGQSLFLPQEHMALTLICFVMIFMEVNKRIFYLLTGLFGLSSQPETVAKIPSFVVKRRIIPL